MIANFVGGKQLEKNICIHPMTAKGSLLLFLLTLQKLVVIIRMIKKSSKTFSFIMKRHMNGIGIICEVRVMRLFWSFLRF